jgi:CheY-like chemotaxis protein
VVAGSAAQGKLVLVEDDSTVRGILSLLFESAGWEVAAAPDGVLGLATAERVEPDVVVTDLRMPRMSGLQLAAELASANDGETPIPLIAITSDRADLREAAVRSGLFVEVLTKPLAPQELLATVSRATRAGRRSEE